MLNVTNSYRVSKYLFLSAISGLLFIGLYYAVHHISKLFIILIRVYRLTEKAIVMGIKKDFHIKLSHGPPPRKDTGKDQMLKSDGG